jgi:hypothetical protein
MNIAFIIAGLLALTAAAIHGGLGEKIVVTKLRRETLPTSKFGGSSMTLLMIRVTWHITTLAFLVLGSALLVCSPGAPGDACEGIGRLSSISFASFFLLAAALAAPNIRRTVQRHPAPLVFALVAVLSWWGAGR